MKKNSLFLIIFQCLLLNSLHSQSVGIGTTTPNTSSSLDMGPSTKPVVLPRLSTVQMNAIPGAAQGMFIYNTTEHQLYTYAQTGEIAEVPVNKWQPVTTGPRMIAWGTVDSFANTLNGSGNFTVLWDATNHWYTLTTTYRPFFRDSMMVMVTPVGNGSWDQCVSIGELITSPTDRKASIKFTDVSRIAGGFNTLDSRRRSFFYFTLYDMRKDPFF